MRSTCLVAALAGLAYAAPKPTPQFINFEEFDSAEVPEVTGPAPGAVSEPVAYSEPVAKAEAAAEVTEELSNSEKRSLVARGVNDPCAPQPDGYGPKPAEDTAAAFLAFDAFSTMANDAPTPQGYALSFSNKQASVSLNSYLGLYTLKSYDPIKCQQLCDAANLCSGFNIFYERNPTLAPAEACPKPASLTNIKCTLWGSPVTPESAKNKGQYRRDFQVVIAGSNGYTKNNPPEAQPGFTGPVALGGAINAPNSYIGQKYFPGVYDAGLCAGACQANTAYNRRHPRADGTYDACNFYNVYLLSKNNQPEGTYCSLYTKAWEKKYSTNFGQYRGSDYYSVSSSYAYTLAPLDPGRI
ncbi:MAG: hypothetical protein Q9192_007727 [Flavoplaca navasiana]